MTQLLQKPASARTARSTDPQSVAEDVSFQLVMGRRVSGFPVPMPRTNTEIDDLVDDAAEHSETVICRTLPRPIIDALNADEPQAQTEGFVAGLKYDAKSLLDQSKSMMWFLPSWAWSVPAMLTYLAITVGVIWQIVRAERQ